MKLDPDLVRAILLKAEEAPPNTAPGDIEIDGRTEDEVLETVALMTQGGLLNARISDPPATSNSRVYLAYVEGLTWEGHDFLANAKNEKGWVRVKEKIKSSGAAMTIEMLKFGLKEYGKSLIGGGSDAL